LLVDLAIKNKTTNIIRGIRNANDFEYEQNLFQVNRTLLEQFETIFLIAKNDNKHISSSVVRELVKLNGDYSSFVEDNVLKFIKEK
jgi:pantetheine-phosphate adenylyltransferase